VILEKRDNESGKRTNAQGVSQPVSVANTLNAHMIKSLHQIVANVDDDKFTL